MTRSPTIGEVLDQVRANAAADVRVCLPAKVTRWDAAKQQVDVQPLVKDVYKDEDGNRQTEALPVIPCVPVMFPGSGSLCITFPITVGDIVLVVFSDVSLDKWLATGGTVDPDDERRHHLTDAVAFPGLRTFGGTPGPRRTAPSGSAIQLGTDGGTFQGVALGADVKSWLDGLRTAYNAHKHSDPVSGFTGVPDTLVASASPAASATVKVTP